MTTNEKGGKYNRTRVTSYEGVSDKSNISVIADLISGFATTMTRCSLKLQWFQGVFGLDHMQINCL